MRRPWTRLAVYALLLAGLVAGSAQAQKPLVLYRCTDAGGSVTLQTGKPCPKGSTQEKRSVEAAPVAPPPAAAIAPVSPANAAAPSAMPAPGANPQGSGEAQVPTVLPLPAAQTPPAERLPPPPLYQCNTFDNDSYLSDTPDPKPRCVRLNTVGLDGSQSGGAGEACRMLTDQCQRVPDGAACDAWKRRVREAQAAWTFGRADGVDAARRDYERIARIAAESTCGQ